MAREQEETNDDLSGLNDTQEVEEDNDYAEEDIPETEEGEYPEGEGREEDGELEEEADETAAPVARIPVDYPELTAAENDEINYLMETDPMEAVRRMVMVQTRQNMASQDIADVHLAPYAAENPDWYAHNAPRMRQVIAGMDNKHPEKRTSKAAVYAVLYTIGEDAMAEGATPAAVRKAMKRFLGEEKPAPRPKPAPAKAATPPAQRVPSPGAGTGNVRGQSKARASQPNKSLFADRPWLRNIVEGED